MKQTSAATSLWHVILCVGREKDFDVLELAFIYLFIFCHGADGAIVRSGTALEEVYTLFT